MFTCLDNVKPNPYDDDDDDDDDDLSAKTNACDTSAGYAMLMRPNRAETALHGCYCQSDVAVRKRELYSLHSDDLLLMVMIMMMVMMMTMITMVMMMVVVVVGVVGVVAIVLW